MKLAYVLDRFPVLSETFIAREIEGLAREGVRPELFALGKGEEEANGADVRTPAAEVLPDTFSPRVLSAGLAWFIKSPSRTLRALAGLVGITAGCAVATPLGAIIIGLVSGILVVTSVEFIDKVLHIDDPVGAISVHGIGGAWGTVAVGLFANTDDIKGLFYGGGAAQLGVQAIGVLAVFAWAVGTGFTLFLIIKKTMGLRVTETEELQGLDIGEHGSEAYAGFQIFSTQ